MFLFVLVLAAAPAVDTDRDGLSDFAELHKYLTDPNKPDTDADGVPDGDWNERREYTYSVRAILEVAPPVNLAALNDDFQDARVLEVRADAVEFEVISYPFNTNAAAIAEDPAWRANVAADRELQRWVQPGVTSNWDAELQRQLFEQLADAGIDVATLSDKALVERAAPWLMKHAVSSEVFTTFDVEFVDGGARVPSALDATVARELRKAGLTREQQWNRELYGKAMFENGARGTCTSSAIYLSTCLRGLGLPARSVLFIPVIDGSDERQVKLVSQRIPHPRVQQAILRAAAAGKGSWVSHSFNEVWVGGRWQRLNYERLGQGVLDEKYLGLMIHVNTWGDHAEAGLLPWGLRHAEPARWSDDVFGGPNPYRCASLSELNGAHSKLGPTEHRVLTVSRAYWYDDPKKAVAVVTKQKLDPAGGHLVVHLDQVIADQGAAQYARFLDRASRDFVLRAPGRPDVPARAVPMIWCAGELRELGMEIDAASFATMTPRVPYKLVAPVERGGSGWSVAPDLTITRP